MNIDRESAKWLKLAFETHGPDGAAEMAEALGLPMTGAGRKRVGVPGSSWTTVDSSDTEAWREPVRMPAMCPARKPNGDGRWKRYEGYPWWFHCGYEGFLENRRPSRSQPIAECFYDEEGRLVDQNHPYSTRPMTGAAISGMTREASRRRGGVRSGRGVGATSTSSSGGRRPRGEWLSTGFCHGSSKGPVRTFSPRHIRGA